MEKEIGHHSTRFTIACHREGLALSVARALNMTNLRFLSFPTFLSKFLSYEHSSHQCRHLSDRRTEGGIDLRGIEGRAESTPDRLSCLVLTAWLQTLCYCPLHRMAHDYD